MHNNIHDLIAGKDISFSLNRWAKKELFFWTGDNSSDKQNIMVGMDVIKEVSKNNDA